MTPHKFLWTKQMFRMIDSKNKIQLHSCHHQTEIFKMATINIKTHFKHIVIKDLLSERLTL